MKENYGKAYTEVLEILKYMPQDDVDKIPKEMLEMFENKKDNTYKFEVNESDDFSNLKILDETEAIFINIFKDYWATPEQREKIKAKHVSDIKIIEEEKRKKYNPDNLFKNNTIKTNTVKTNITSEKNLPIKYKETFFNKFIIFIKRLFKL